MKKTIQQVTLCITLALSVSFKTNAQAVDWISTDKGMETDIALDAFNNVYSCGSLPGSTQIGSYYFTSYGSLDVLVEKHSPAGNLLWATQLGGPNADYITSMVYDGMGNIWVTGYFSGSITIGSYTLTSAGGSDIYIAKLNAANGAVLFAESGGGTGSDTPTDLKADASGNIYVNGSFSYSFNYQGIALTGVDAYEVFVLRLSNNGNAQLGMQITSSVYDKSFTVAADNSGNIYVAGLSFDTTANFNGTPVSMGSATGYIVKFDATGNYQWKAPAGFGGGFDFRGLSIDGAGNMYSTGHFTSQAIFGATTLTNGFDTDIFLVKLHSNGNYAWAKNFGGTGGDKGVDLKFDNTGHLFLAATYDGSFTFGTFPVTGNPMYNWLVAKLDSSGTAIWVQKAISISGGTIGPSGIEVNNTGDVFVSGNGSGYIAVGGNSVLVQGSSLIKLIDNANVMEGTVFSDTDNDGIKDLGEPGIENVIAQLDGGLHITNSASDGKYTLYTTSGNHAVSIPNFPLYHTLTTAATQNASFTGTGNADTANHFGFHAIPNINDLRIDVTRITGASAGQVVSYLLTYTNVGTTTLNATVTLQADATLTYISSLPAETSITGNFSTWNVGTLNPGMSGTILSHWNIPVTTGIGTLLLSTAEITPVAGDTTILDNTQSDTCSVTGPYDPNYKTVNIDTLLDVTTSDWLEYIIHFQNVGNDTAYNVIITDTISSYLDVSSLEIISASHQPLTLGIHSNNVLDFRFHNILLPDSTTDAVGSNGFVKYRLKYASTLPLNSIIENLATIYFDYNSPIQTNTATTVHLHVNSMEENGSINVVQVYPNPVSNVLNVSVNTLLSHNATIRIMDVTGKLVQVTGCKEGANQVNVSLLKPGTYLLEVYDTHKHFMIKLVKE